MKREQFDRYWPNMEAYMGPIRGEVQSFTHQVKGKDGAIEELPLSVDFSKDEIEIIERGFADAMPPLVIGQQIAHARLS